MPYVDTERILYGEPTKRLLIGYENLKNNYNQENALAYQELYKDQPLSFIFSNDSIIFGEPFYGYKFFKDIIDSETEYCAFTEYRTIKQDVEKYIADNLNKMGAEQNKMYSDLLLSITNKMDSLKHTLLMSYMCKDKASDETNTFLVKISDELYAFCNTEDEDKKKVIESGILALLSTVDCPITFFTYSPYINLIIHNGAMIHEGIKKFYHEASTKEDALKEDNFKKFITNILTMSTLFNDEKYRNAVSFINNVMDRMVLTELSKESVKDQINNISTESVSEINTFYSTTESAVNSIFDDMEENEYNESENDQIKLENARLENIVYESLLDMLSYQMNCLSESEFIPTLNYFDERMTLENALDMVSEGFHRKTEMIDTITEKQEFHRDVLTDDEKDLLHGQDFSDKEEKLPKKISVPEPKDLAAKIQNKAMDVEVKQREKMAKSKEKGQELRNAGKAVTNVPMNVINDIKEQINALDDKDTAKRKKYMTEPGFRKKAFKNLKLAILYGTAAQAKLALVPVTMFARHLSKERDRRVRNDLIFEINTNIKVCEEKISDAAANGDTQQKYKLMRIKEKLNAELLRVKTNSKYV